MAWTAQAAPGRHGPLPPTKLCLCTGWRPSPPWGRFLSAACSEAGGCCAARTRAICLMLKQCEPGRDSRLTFAPTLWAGATTSAKTRAPKLRRPRTGVWRPCVQKKNNDFTATAQGSHEGKQKRTAQNSCVARISEHADYHISPGPRAQGFHRRSPHSCHQCHRGRATMPWHSTG